MFCRCATAQRGGRSSGSVETATLAKTCGVTRTLRTRVGCRGGGGCCDAAHWRTNDEQSGEHAHQTTCCSAHAFHGLSRHSTLPQACTEQLREALLVWLQGLGLRGSCGSNESLAEEQDAPDSAHVSWQLKQCMQAIAVALRTPSIRARGTDLFFQCFSEVERNKSKKKKKSQKMEKKNLKKKLKTFQQLKETAGATGAHGCTNTVISTCFLAA